MASNFDIKNLINKAEEKLDALAKKEDEEYDQLKNLNIPYHFRLLRYTSIALYILAIIVLFFGEGSAFELLTMSTCVLGGIILTGSSAIITALYTINQPGWVSRREAEIEFDRRKRQEAKEDKEADEHSKKDVAV